MSSTTSYRRGIQWLPSGALTEPTSTLVLTSPGPQRYYIDLRFSQPGPLVRDPVDVVSHVPAQLYWGFCGTSTSTSTTTTWHHAIDSRSSDAASDSGVCSPLPDGTVRETGRMLDFDDGCVKEYIEYWADEVRTDTYVWAAALLPVQVAGKDAQGFLMRVGPWFQAIVKAGEKTEAVRWVRDEGIGGWRRMFYNDVVLAGLGSDVPIWPDEEGVDVEWAGLVWREVELRIPEGIDKGLLEY